MPEFQYIARAMSGQEVRGLLTAGTETEVVSTLSSRQLFPLRIELAESARSDERLRGRRVRARDLATFYAQLSDLLRSGVPLLRSLELLQRQTRNKVLKVVLQEVRDDVAEGTRLAEALRQHGNVFPELAVSMVRAGEEGSFLEDVLRRIADFTEHQEDLKGRVIGATVYPLFLSVVGSVVLTVMMVWFVPKFEPVFQRLEARGELPWATTAVVAISDTLGNYGLFVALAAAGGIGLAMQYCRTDEGRLILDRVKLEAPGAGRIYRSLAIARFCRILGTLLNNGVPILNSLRIAKDATGNRILSNAIHTASDFIAAGKSLAEPLRSSGEFPEETVEIIAVAEEANNLEKVLVDIAESMERRTYRYLELFVRLLEPVMLLIMATLILFVMLGLLLPVLQSSSVL
ncbi:MAG: type II secretion system F family protein [Planctomycetota bacterium]|nr:type II secretion system F family protein [Planctomycetota bacterium]MDA1163155.1 type II secretion system F family protein [Planctomycetota bacterium]